MIWIAICLGVILALLIVFASVGRLRSQQVEIVRQLVSPPRNDWMSGLQLIAGSDGKLKRGTIYVALEDLEDLGIVESELNTEGRRLYRLKR